MALPEEPLPRAQRVLVEPAYLAVRWPGVWTGFLISIGVFVILTALGLAVGATAVGNNGSPQTLANGAAWWGGISFLIALFIGGAIAARWVTGGMTSVLQGALVWVLAVLAVLALASFGISLGANGLFAGLGARILANSPDFAQLTSPTSQVGTTGTIAAAQSAEPTAWTTFIVLCVSALAAIVGAVVGRQRIYRPLV